MKKLFLSLLLCLSMIQSCDNENAETKIREDVVSTNSKMVNSEASNKTNGSLSVGEMHNIYLQNMYVYLSNQNNLSPSNIDQHAYNFFETIENGNVASEYYQHLENNGQAYFQFSTTFQQEIQQFQLVLQNSDFVDMAEFKNFVSEYSPTYITNKNELIAWGYYTDVFTHSFDYWTNNIDGWKELFANNSSSASKFPICQIYLSWWKRAWCNVISFVAIDAAGAGFYALGALISGMPIIFGPIVGASIGASINAATSNYGGE